MEAGEVPQREERLGGGEPAPAEAEKAFKSLDEFMSKDLEGMTFLQKSEPEVKTLDKVFTFDTKPYWADVSRYILMRVRDLFVRESSTFKFRVEAVTLVDGDSEVMMFVP